MAFCTKPQQDFHLAYETRTMFRTYYKEEAKTQSYVSMMIKHTQYVFELKSLVCDQISLYILFVHVLVRLEEFQTWSSMTSTSKISNM